jgi:hypothetical protein
MSFISDKVACKECGYLYDVDCLEDGECFECIQDREMLEDGFYDEDET